MRVQRLPMSIDEFHLLARKPGWKYEYWDGRAHIRPAHAAADLTLPLAPREVTSPLPLRPVTPSDAAVLSLAFYRAFRDTAEYCDWSARRVRESSVDCIETFFSSKRGATLEASLLAETPRGSIAGAALILREPEGTPMLDILLVVPRWQHRGLGTAMVGAGVNLLHATGESVLHSRCFLANEASVRWHRRFGFVEEPNLFLAQRYQRCARHELGRREQIGDLTPAERAGLQAECDRWDAEFARLDAEFRSQWEREGANST